MFFIIVWGIIYVIKLLLIKKNTPKLIQVKIVKIKYSGDLIGDDVKIEVDCLGNLSNFKKKLKPSSEINPNLSAGSFVSDNKIFNLPISIKIIEEDLIFNDVGSRLLNLKIDLKANAVKVEICKIEVTELRNFITKNKAIFEVSVEISVEDAVLYVDNIEGGWVNAVSDNIKKEIALPSYLKVYLERNYNGRQYFKILEGIRRGERASLKYGDDKQSFLVATNPQTESAKLTYSVSKKELYFQNKIYKATDYKNNQWEKGSYDIEMPDAPHRGGGHYPESKMAKTWFRVGHNGDHYIHTGARSAGCVTLTEIDRWDELCNILLRARKGDYVSIGVLVVIN